MKKQHFISLLTALMLLTVSCEKDVSANDESESASESATATDTVTETEADAGVIVDGEIVIAQKGVPSKFSLVYNVDLPKDERDVIFRVKEMLEEKLGSSISLIDDFYEDKESKYEIIVNSKKRSESKELVSGLKKDEYSIKAVVTDKKTSIIIAFDSVYAGNCVMDIFEERFLTKEGVTVPVDTNIKASATIPLIESGIGQLRDPCVLLDDGTYYIYGTGWTVAKNTTGKLDSGWSNLTNCVITPRDCDGDQWAPEVYKYNGEYYMFTTYRSKKTGHRGCSVFKAKRPVGPFKEISDGHVTPENWDAIDGSLYIDKNGDPYMIFVHEWTSMPDGIGSFAYAKMNPELTEFVTEPVEMFKANDASWAKNGVTDGCWMYTAEDDSLIMLWSNSDKGGYCVGIAKSESGKLEGPWIHMEELLYSGTKAKYDGGHGMLFTDENGQMFLSIHSPNTASQTRGSMPVFIPVKEKDNMLIVDYGFKEK